MVRFLFLFVLVLLTGCATSGAIHLQAVETEGYYSVIAPVDNGEVDCRLTFAEQNGILVLVVDDPINKCSLSSTDVIEYALLHREESAGSPTVFRRGVMRPFDIRQLERFHVSYNAVAVIKVGQTAPSSVVVLIDKDVGLQGCAFGHSNECVGEH